MQDHDPGDEHRDPWVGTVSRHEGWHTAVAELDRTTGRRSIVYADGRVEDISGVFELLRGRD